VSAVVIDSSKGSLLVKSCPLDRQQKSIHTRPAQKEMSNPGSGLMNEQAACVIPWRKGAAMICLKQ
jgi:hypothetical protein